MMNYLPTFQTIGLKTLLFAFPRDPIFFNLVASLHFGLVQIPNFS